MKTFDSNRLELNWKNMGRTGWQDHSNKVLLKMDDYFALRIYRASSPQDTELKNNHFYQQNTSLLYALPKFPEKAVIVYVSEERWDYCRFCLCTHMCIRTR